MSNAFTVIVQFPAFLAVILPYVSTVAIFLSELLNFGILPSDEYANKAEISSKTVPVFKSNKKSVAIVDDEGNITGCRCWLIYAGTDAAY